MKKFVGVLGSFLILFLCVGAGSASASWSSWQDVPKKSGCEVRVWTDYTNYYQGARTVDAKAEQRGSCGTLYYGIYIFDENILNDTYQTGYFSYMTPVKYLDITGHTISKTISTRVHLDLYGNSSHTTSYGSVYSNTINIYDQNGPGA